MRRHQRPAVTVLQVAAGYVPFGVAHHRMHSEQVEQVLRLMDDGVSTGEERLDPLIRLQSIAVRIT